MKNSPSERPSDDIEDLVRLVSHRSEEIAIALGLPREAKYIVLSALGTEAILPELAPRSIERARAQATASATRRLPSFVLEIVQGVKHVAQFVRSFPAGQTPPAFQPSLAVSTVLMGPTGSETPPTSPIEIGTAGPVAIAVTEDPSGEVILTLRLVDPAAGLTLVRLYRGYEGAETPPVLVASFDLSPDQTETSHHLARADFTALRIEAEPRA